MYRINPLMRNVLSTTDEILFHAPTKHTLDPRTIEQSIIIADESWIREALGNPLYYDFIAAKNKVVTADNLEDFKAKTGNQDLQVGDIVNAVEFLSPAYQTLWYQHLWKLCAEVVMLIATPEAFVQFGSEGVIHSAPQSNPLMQGNIVTPGLQSIKYVMDKKVFNRIDPLIAAMQNWICMNKKNYPLYDKQCCKEDGIANKRKSPFILDIYGDDNDKNCGCGY